MTSTSSIDTRPMLIVISAGNCGACQHYEKSGIFQKTKEDIDKMGLIRYDHIKLQKIGDPVPSTYPAVLNKWARWFPIFILINGNDWNDKMVNIDEKSPNVEIFNGKFMDGVLLGPNNGGTMLDHTKIPEWIKTNAETNPKFKITIIKNQRTIFPTLPAPVQVTDAEPKYIPTCGAMKILASSRRTYG